ncbi:MAG: hypothetical protein HFE76_06235 [Firmicutes bacterium]|nr:hypothetical protein [Bacillota bacterium]
MKHSDKEIRDHKVLLQIIRLVASIVFIIIGSVVFQTMMRKGYFSQPSNKILFLLILMGGYLALSFLEYQYLLKYKKEKAEIKRMILHNILIVAGAIFLLGIIMFLF